MMTLIERMPGSGLSEYQCRNFACAKYGISAKIVNPYQTYKSSNIKEKLHDK